ncbi:MAG: hypothetical protein HYU66_18955 [Armatimonadetes bacterium]|nr:hypothetical protein [Armatimonadota bacterium]
MRVDSDPAEALRPLVAVLLPFRPEFRPVYAAIQVACQEAGLECRRADDVWKATTSFQATLDLLRAAAVVVVDWSDKHPSVVFLAGVAHMLGKTVIPLTQHDYDIPAGLPKSRYLKYQCNRDGLDRLRTLLAERLATCRP